MRVAALDLGSNTFLCLIADVEGGRIVRVVHDVARTVRLGQEVNRTGCFHPDALARADQCLREFRQLIDECGVEKTFAGATAAARSVTNGEELLKIGNSHGFPIQIISGEREAELSYTGAWSSFGDEKTRLVVDIGGGSTELIVGRGSRILSATSLPLGGVRQTEKHITAQPVPEIEGQNLRTEVEGILLPALNRMDGQMIEEVVAVAGTPTAIAAVELGGFDAAKVDGYWIEVERLRRWCDIFSSTSVEEKREKYGLGGRADIIYVGATILERIISQLGCTGFRVSARGLRYGLVLDHSTVAADV